uniref:Uncharacterized protein n=1 Tax=Siphoviridae sp. ctJyX12 TaxID=2827840 RepID=A0A8S5SQ52_9CAUD|nr:MAG TPA: hypothetical protein [Siphoviridae sp. ctJyX12]
MKLPLDARKRRVRRISAPEHAKSATKAAFSARSLQTTLPRAPASASRELCVALRLVPHFWCQKYQCCFTLAFMCASN